MGKGIGTKTGKLSRRLRDTRSAVQRTLDDRKAAAAVAWAARHPSMAKEQRSLRKQQAERIKSWDHKRAGTIETHDHAARTHQGALVQLHVNGTIDNDQLEWAAEIANVYRSIGSDVGIAISSLEARIDEGRRTTGSVEGIRRVRLHYAYTLWREALPAPKQMILDMIVGDAVGYSVAARRHGVHNRKAKRLLIEALSAWPVSLTRAFRSVKSEDLDLANAA